MKIRFQADADLNEDIVNGVIRRAPEIDFRTAGEAGLQDLRDEKVLELSARDGRILVTHDWRTMPRHFGEFIAAHHHSPGVLIVSQQTEVLEAIESLLLIWSASEAEEYTNTIRRIPF